MKRFFRDADGPVLVNRGSVVCIGAFDGFHRGHMALLARAHERARARGLPLAVVSFEPLPRQHFQGRATIARLSSPRQRVRALLDVADLVGMLRFGRELAHTSAEEFVRRVLVGRLAAREVWVGPGFRFGHERRGDLALLAAMGVGYGFTAHAVDAVAEDGQRISASAIRDHLGRGDFAAAARSLGRPYAMAGRVVHGKQLGRTLGYPTANLRIPYGRPPLHGIYAVRVDVGALRDWPAVASLGTRPTVDGREPLLESHLFDFDGDLYGQLMEVRFVAHLRDEEKFGSLDALVEQMHDDARRARQLLAVPTHAAGALYA
jgi:riboflavin kinase/FMN adenylyltransferase